MVHVVEEDDAKTKGQYIKTVIDKKLLCFRSTSHHTRFAHTGPGNAANDYAQQIDNACSPVKSTGFRRFARNEH